MVRFQNYVMLFKMAARFPDIWALENILVPVSWQTKSENTPFWLVLSLSPTPYIIHWSRWQLFCLKTGPKLQQTAIFWLVTTWIGAQTTNSNRNIAGKKNLKSLPVAFFSQKFNIDFTVYAHKMVRFQNCVMLFKMAARFPDIWALENILVPVSWQTKSENTPFWLVLSLSPTPYIIHWSRWQLFCLETGPKLQQTAIFWLVTTWIGAQTTNLES